MKKLILLFATALGTTLGATNPTLRNITDRTYTTIVDCCAQINTDLTATWTIINDLNNKLNNVSCSGGSICNATAISSSTTVTTAGSYCLAKNLNITSGDGITINADNVTLDLDGRTIAGTGGNNGIVVEPNHSNITIHNGIICSMAKNGILLEGNYCTVRDCNFVANDTGITLQQTYGTILHNCTAQENSSAGFSLISSFTNYVLECKALGNGSNANAYGFITSNGTGNLFEHCLSEGTNTIAITSEYIAAGIALTGSEQYTNVIDCKVDHTYTSNNRSVEATPYGIYLKQLPMNNELLSTATQNSYDIAWNSTNYLAVSDPDSKTDLFLFSNNAFTRFASYPPTPTAGGLEVAWGGNYLATAGAPAGSPSYNLVVYASPFNASTLQGSGTVESPTWRDNQFLAVYDDSDTSMHVFEFTSGPGATLTHRNSVSLPNGGRIDWQSGSDYIATVTIDTTGDPTYVTTISVYEFNKTTYALTLLVSTTKSENKAHYASEISWSPDGQYLCCSGVDEGGGANANVIIYQFNNGTPSLTEVDKKFYTNGSSPSSALRQAWSPDSSHIAISGDTNVNSAQQYAAAIYPVLTSTPDILLKPLASTNFFSIMAWSSQNYLAIITEDLTLGTSELSLFTNLASCLFKNNVICFTNGGETPLGVGISGMPIQTDNMFISNFAYSNDTNYQNVSNVSVGLSSNVLDNISMS
jgi:hypothetical protein